MCGNNAVESPNRHWRCSSGCIQSLNDDIDHKTALEEILFWTVKYEFPEKITTWLLALLPDDEFKVNWGSSASCLVTLEFIMVVTTLYKI